MDMRSPSLGTHSLLAQASLSYRARHTAGIRSTKVAIEADVQHSLYGINLLETWILEEAEASNAKVGVEHIDHVTRPVRQTAILWILRLCQRSIQLQPLQMLTWHCKMKDVSFLPSIQYNLSSMARLLMTHQL